MNLQGEGRMRALGLRGAAVLTRTLLTRASGARLLVWLGLAVVLAAWSLLAYGVSALVGMGGDALAAGAVQLPFDASALRWIAGVFPALAGLMQGLVFVLWLLLSLALLGLGGLAQGVAPLLLAMRRVRRSVRSTDRQFGATGPPDDPSVTSTSATYDVRPERVTHD